MTLKKIIDCDYPIILLNIGNDVTAPYGKRTIRPISIIFFDQIKISLDKSFMGPYCCTHVDRSTIIRGDWSPMNPELFFCLTLE